MNDRRVLDREVNTVGSSAVRTAAAVAAGAPRRAAGQPRKLLQPRRAAGDATARVARTALAHTRAVAGHRRRSQHSEVAASPKNSKMALVALQERHKLVADSPNTEEIALLEFLGLLAPEGDFPGANLELALLDAPHSNQEPLHHQLDNNFLPNGCIRGWLCKPACLLAGNFSALEESLLLVGSHVVLGEAGGPASQTAAAAHTTHS